MVGNRWLAHTDLPRSRVAEAGAGIMDHFGLQGIEVRRAGWRYSKGGLDGVLVLVSSVRHWFVVEDCWEIVGGQPKMAVPLLKRVPPPRVFWEKRLEVIENKGDEGGKEGKERCKRLQPA